MNIDPNKPLYQPFDFSRFDGEAFDIRKELNKQAAGGMAQQFDDEIRRIADERLPAGWTAEDIAEHFSIDPAKEGDQRQVIRFDGHVVLKLGPFESETVMKGDRYVMTIKRDVKRY